MTPVFLELWDVALDPSQDCGVRDIDSALSHHFYQVAIAELVGNIPADTENDYSAVEVAATKQG